MHNELVVRIEVVGHASKRWRAARTKEEADRLNQQLSEARAANIRKVVEEIVRKELPNISIEVPGWGVGSRDPFPTAGEDNAAVDRSVVVGISLDGVETGERTESRPAKIYTPSRFWTFRVLAQVGATTIGAKAVFMRIGIKSNATGRELVMSGWLFGGGFGFMKKDLFQTDNLDRKSLQKIFKPVGMEVTFQTNGAKDFDYFVGDDNGQSVRVIHGGLGVVRKRETTLFQFRNLEIPSLVYEWTKGWTTVTLNPSVVSGTLTVEGPVPDDYVVSTRMVTVPTMISRPDYDALLLSFPTGRSGFTDLAPRDRQQLIDFATWKARTIRSFAELGDKITNPRP
jgi:hypothetical protein